MTPAALRWAIVLGAGDGTRLHSLTRNSGTPVPKQYCTLSGGPSLFDLALERAERVVAPSSVVTVVAERHRNWWSRDLARLQRSNVVVQPDNRGTAAGVLLPLLEVQRRDPEGRVVLLPSDHWVEDERVLADAIGAAFELLEREPRRILMLGISPDQPESGYGWIVPGAPRSTAGGVLLHCVEAFVEKPDTDIAAGLMERGGLWNSFLIVASVQALVELYSRRLPRLLGILSLALDDESTLSLADVYQWLETRDFSRDLMQGAEADLGGVHVPPCGWTDLGTPLRVADCVRRSGFRSFEPPGAAWAGDRVNLASLLDFQADPVSSGG